MSTTTTIVFDHAPPKPVTMSNEEYNSQVDDGELVCSVELEVELDFEPGDKNYGADADGNRGISVPGYAYPINEPPDVCPECGKPFTKDELKAIDARFSIAADNFKPDVDDIPEPDPDEHRYGYGEMP